MASISDTILRFGEPVLGRLLSAREPPSLELLKRGLELVITVWNAHVMATADWGHPEYLENLRRAALTPQTAPDMLAQLEALDALRAAHFADDVRVVSKWDLALDEQGQRRFDCTARLPRPHGGLQHSIER